MNAAAKGRRAEHGTQAVLEAAGYQTTRAAASKGPADIVAWNTTAVRFISVKSGTRYASAVEREALRLLPRPLNATVEIWRWPTRSRTPLVEVL